LEFSLFAVAPAVLFLASATWSVADVDRFVRRFWTVIALLGGLFVAVGAVYLFAVDFVADANGGSHEPAIDGPAGKTLAVQVAIAVAATVAAWIAADRRRRATGLVAVRAALPEVRRAVRVRWSVFLIVAAFLFAAPVL